MRVPLRLERQNAILPATTMPRAFHHREIAPSFERAADRATRAFANFPQKEETTGVKSVEEKAGERERERESVRWKGDEDRGKRRPRRERSRGNENGRRARWRRGLTFGY